MKETSTQKSNFYIQGFMVELGLKTSRLLLYALIYSYTVSGDGLYWGSRAYLAQCTGMSIRTVQAAIAELISDGLIERSEKGERKGLRATVIKEKEKSAANFAAQEENISESISEKGEEKPKIYEPKHRFISRDKWGLVTMTEAQYTALCRLADAQTVAYYIDRLSLLIREDGYSPHNQYRLIKKWIKEDAEL